MLNARGEHARRKGSGSDADSPGSPLPLHSPHLDIRTPGVAAHTPLKHLMVPRGSFGTMRVKEKGRCSEMVYSKVYSKVNRAS